MINAINLDIMFLTIHHEPIWKQEDTIFLGFQLFTLPCIILFYYYFLFNNKVFHPSIHFLYRLSSRGSQGSWSQSHPTLGKRRFTPWTVRHSITGLTYNIETDNHSHLQAIERPINRTCMLLVCRKKSEYLERTHAERTWWVQTQKPLCCEATALNRCTTLSMQILWVLLVLTKWRWTWFWFWKPTFGKAFLKQLFQSNVPVTLNNHSHNHHH